MISPVLIFYLLIFFFLSVFVFQQKKYIVLNESFFFICFFVFLLLLLLYKGEKSDWRAYRYSVDNYMGLGSSYFEKGFDFLLFIASKTFGFEIIPVITLCVFSYFDGILFMNYTVMII